MRFENKKKKTQFIHYLIFIILIINLGLFYSYFQFNTKKERDFGNNSLKISAIQGYLNLTNGEEIDGKLFRHNSTILIKGELTHPDPIKQNDLKNREVSIYVDGQLTPFKNNSDDKAEFFIEYTISLDLDVETQHLIQANITEDIGGDIILLNNYSIDVNASSYFDVSTPLRPYIPGEDYNLNGFIRYDSINGTPISNELINYNWYNSTYSWTTNSFLSGVDGSLQNIQIPLDLYSTTINLNLTFPEIPNEVEFSEYNILNIEIFRNISCTWNILNETSEGEDYTIRGQIWEKGNPSRKIYNRQVNLYYEGEGLIGSATTDANGNFSFIYSIPSGTGNRTIRIQLVNTAGLFLTNQTQILITAGVPILPPGFNIRPFQWFFIIGLPIIIGIIAALGIYGYFYYKKEISASRLVNIPLEGKIRNLKILKDSGRIEEALSYLFNAIYVELVGAKYGRKRKFNETIRDFAIISVQDFKLDPAKIYPFIQKIEQIIYAQPFKVTEEEFYKTIELFSPVYYQLTGYNFILNF
ncbi:MAG: hypothetical protein EU542_08610 [Promethearchaeota archaeon]|nr:MAG: hypothetical protein EU542_08610 [Candidatus Lokiarchaeota archaeon]